MARYRRVQTVTHDIGPEGTLVLAVTSADVRLNASAGARAEIQATFEVEASSEADADAIFEAAKMRVDAAEGRLEVVEEDGRGRGLGSAISQLLAGHHVDLEEVEGSAPPGCRLEFRAVSGDAQAAGFRGAQRYQTVSGDLRLVGGGGDLEIQSVSGDVVLRAVSPASLKVSTVSGDLSAEAPVFDHLRVNAVSGDVSADGALGTGKTHVLDTVSGDVRLASNTGMTVAVRGLASDIHASFAHRVEGSLERRRMIVGDGTASVTFNSMSGDLDVTRSRQTASPAPAAGDAAETRATAAAPAETAATSAADDKLTVLGALERGEIDVDEAMRRLGDVR